MTREETRSWWPFSVQPPGGRSVENEIKVAFLEAADSLGLRAYVDRDDCGALASDGRECLIVWRGKQRAELVLIDGDVIQSRKLYNERTDGEAFRQASAESLDWFLTRPVLIGAVRSGEDVAGR